MKIERRLYKQSAEMRETSRAGDYEQARESYAALRVDTDAAVQTALNVPISLHCWQADDVRGLEVREEPVDSGGIQATGNYPGAARTGDEMNDRFTGESETDFGAREQRP